jgi:hypothetical protein
MRGPVHMILRCLPTRHHLVGAQFTTHPQQWKHARLVELGTDHHNGVNGMLLLLLLLIRKSNAVRRSCA